MNKLKNFAIYLILFFMSTCVKPHEEYSIAIAPQSKNDIADYANLLTTREKRVLLSRCKEIRSKYKVRICVLTLTSSDEKWSDYDYMGPHVARIFHIPYSEVKEDLFIISYLKKEDLLSMEMSESAQNKYNYDQCMDVFGNQVKLFLKHRNSFELFNNTISDIKNRISKGFI